VKEKEKGLDYLLELISPALEDQSRQAPTFALLKATVTRRFVVPEIYDLMKRVSEIFGQSPHVQELCRLVLLRFLLDSLEERVDYKTRCRSLPKNCPISTKDERMCDGASQCRIQARGLPTNTRLVCMDS
jgi:U3 small nucleolar RNA-associated protein 20